MKYDFIFDSLRQAIVQAAPNYVMRDDLVRLEGRVDELVEIAAELEALLESQGKVAPPRRRRTLSERDRSGGTHQ